MIANQLGLRNLSAKQISYLRGMQQQREKQTVANPDGSNQYIEVKPQNEVQPLENTAARLAKQYGVSKATIERDVEYTKAVDAIVAATAPEVQQQILGSDSKLTKLATLKLAKLAKKNLAAMPDILEEVRQAPNKTAASAIVRESIVRESISKTRETPINKDEARIDFDNAAEAIDWLKRRFSPDELEALCDEDFDEANEED
jgi:hypothetical protein